MRLSSSEFRPGFDWVVSELVMTEASKEALFASVHSSLYEGMAARLKALKPVWPMDGQWPAGHSALQEELRQELEDEEDWQEGDPLPDVAESDVLKLLLTRFAHVAQRTYRNQQIRELYADASFRRRHPFIVMNREPSDEPARCGRGSNIELPVEEGLLLMEQLACAHPSCRCTFDPKKA